MTDDGVFLIGNGQITHITGPRGVTPKCPDALFIKIRSSVCGAASTSGIYPNVALSRRSCPQVFRRTTLGMTFSANRAD